MTCQDVSFARARCRIDVEPRSDADIPMFAARISIVEDNGRLLRALTFADGARVEIHGSTELLALNSAVTYLEAHLGPKSEPEFDCDATASPHVGAPVVIDDVGLAAP